jgi:hypothetical protein
MCKDCTSGRDAYCDKCFSRYQLISGQCVDCQNVQLNCLQCEMAQNVQKNIICAVCDNGYYLIKQDTNEGRCA